MDDVDACLSNKQSGFDALDELVPHASSLDCAFDSPAGEAILALIVVPVLACWGCCVCYHKNLLCFKKGICCFCRSNAHGMRLSVARQGAARVAVTAVRRAVADPASLASQQQQQQPQQQVTVAVRGGATLPLPRLAAGSRAVARPIAQQASDHKKLDQIGELHSLFQSGALTEAEFTAAKARVLGSLGAPPAAHAPTPTPAAGGVVVARRTVQQQPAGAAASVPIAVPVATQAVSVPLVQPAAAARVVLL